MQNANRKLKQRVVHRWTGKRYQTQVLFTTIGTWAAWNAPAIYGVQLGAKF